LPAFVDAVRDFNKDKLRYTWVRYLPTREPLQSFLKPFHLQLKELLPHYSILYSQRGGLVSLNNLIHVLEKYKFKWEPVTINANSARIYLSDQHSTPNLNYLETLGVSKMSELSFFVALQLMVQNTLGEFKKRPEAWHSHLAGILIIISQTYHLELFDISLVPLDNASWVWVRAKQILFPTTSAEFDLPKGLELLVMDSKLAKGFTRRKLFTNVGVGDFK
jgi:hypothetical protein